MLKNYKVLENSKQILAASPHDIFTMTRYVTYLSERHFVARISFWCC